MFLLKQYLQLARTVKNTQLRHIRNTAMAKSRYEYVKVMPYTIL